MLKWIIALGCLSLIGCASTATKNKEKAELYLRMGSTQMESGDYPQALRNILQAEELDPNNPVIQNNLGMVYFMRERYDLAEKHLVKATSLDPKYSDARNNLSRAYIEVSKFDLAEKEVQQVLNDLTYPNPERAYMNLGLVKFNQKQYTAARVAFSKALKQVPDDCAAATYYGRSFFEAGDYSQAAEALDKAIGFCQKSQYDEPHYYSALAYYRLGEKSKSIARFEGLIKFYPSGSYREKAKGMLSLIRKGH